MLDERGDLVDDERLARMSWLELNHLNWINGICTHLMHPGQQAMHAKYRAWEPLIPRNPTDNADTFRRVFTLPISKRWGKTSSCLWLKSEDAIRRPGSKFRYTSAFDKSIASIIGDVQREVFRHAPDSVRPTYHSKRGPKGAGFYFPEYGPAAGSVIYLHGLESNPDALRGEESDGDVISECGFIPGLLYVVRNVLYQQYQGKDHARMVMESSAPKDLQTDWEVYFLPDAHERGATFSATIEDNPRLSRAQKDEWLEAAGGRGNPDCEREYFNVIAVPSEERVVPEFDPLRHVQEWPTPAHAHAYVSVDPGSQDLFGIVYAHWDFSRGALYFVRDWAERNASTFDVATEIDAGERELWGKPGPVERERFVHRGTRLPGDSQDMERVRGWHPLEGAPEGALSFYDGHLLRPNPYMRVTDIDRRLGTDLGQLYGLDFNPADKTDSAEARTNAFRDAMRQGLVIIHPRCVKLIAHLQGARWNKNRTDWSRTTVMGHFDLMAAAIQLWRIVAQNRHMNPSPPYRPAVARGTQIEDSLPWQKSASPENRNIQIVREVLGIDSSPRRPGVMRVKR